MAIACMEPNPISPRNELDLITESQLADLMKICKRQVYNWRMAGIIPYFKLGKAVRFRASDVMAALEKMRIGQ